MKRISQQIISCLFFALLGFQIKIYTLNLNIESIVFFRSLFAGLILFSIIICKKKISYFNVSKFNKVFLLRTIFGAVAMYFGYSSLLHISLSQATTLGFTKVFFTVLLSWIFFSEKINYSKFTLIFLGFFGVYLISEPGFLIEPTGFYYIMISSMAVSLGIITVIYLGKKEETLKILFFNSFLSTIVFGLLFYKEIDFNFFIHKVEYLVLTVTAILGQYFNTESYRNEKSAPIVLVSYSRIIFAFFIGLLFLGEKLSIQSVFGITIIALTTILISLEKKS